MQYELAPFPLVLFDETGIHKIRKAARYDMFEVTRENLDFENYDLVVDGGFLLHNVIWPTGGTASSICQSYVNYILKHYPGKSCAVVFDGYSNVVNSTKEAEHHRRYKVKRSIDILFYGNTKIIVNQDIFLSNNNNNINADSQT